MIWLHWDNDGLWFQGDAPRHAMNGIFWRDLIREGLGDPVEYTQRYYARYPAITPTRYPPGFYIVEASAFACFGVSTFVAKFAVFLFALVASIYMLLGMRRWIAAEAGLVTGLMLLMPGMIRWSHAVMLNVPATALAIAFLFHVRRAIQSTDTTDAQKQCCIGVILATISLAIHPTIGYVALIAIAWLVISGRVRLLIERRVIVVEVICCVILLMLFGGMFYTSPEQFSQASVQLQRFSRIWSLGFYFFSLPSLVSAGAIPFVLLGGLWTLIDKRFRSDGLRLLAGFVIAYTCLTAIWAKDPRYLLIACAAATWLIAVACVGIASRIELQWGPKVSRGMFAAMLCGMGGYLGINARNQFLPKVNGMEQVVAFVETLAPSEPVVYHGTFDGTFIYYLRVRDPSFQRQVVLARKSLLQDGESTATIDVDKLADRLRQIGCRWLILEKPSARKQTPFESALQMVAERPEYELVKTFEGPSRSIERIALFRILNESTDIFPTAVPMLMNGKSIDPWER